MSLLTVHSAYFEGIIFLLVVVWSSSTSLVADDIWLPFSIDSSDPCLQIPGCLFFSREFKFIQDYWLHVCVKYSQVGACFKCSASPHWSYHSNSLPNLPFPCLEVSICNVIKKVKSVKSFTSGLLILMLSVCLLCIDVDANSFCCCT